MRIEVIDPCRSESQINDEHVQKSVAFLKDAGLDIDILPEHQDPSKRAKLFTETVSRTDADYTWIVRGGIEAINLLPYIDFPSLSIKNTLIGSSDFTHLALPILKEGNSVIYGVDLRGLSSNPNMTNTDRESLLKLLREGITNKHLDMLNGKAVDTTNLVGGTLQILINLLGTKYMPDLEGRNLYVEHHYIPGESRLEAKY